MCNAAPVTESFELNRANWDERVPAHLAFDLVYTGVGALTWLPGIRRWGTVPWRAFSGETMASAGSGEWRLAEMPARLAASFTIAATKNS